jgi:hypothetical protein
MARDAAIRERGRDLGLQSRAAKEAGRRTWRPTPRAAETRLGPVAADPDYEAVIDQLRVVGPAESGPAVQVEGPDPERCAVRAAGEPLTGSRVVDRDRGERVVVAKRVVARHDSVARQEWEVVKQ